MSKVLQLLLQVLVYNGNKDIMCNTPGNLNVFSSMTAWSGRNQFVGQEAKPFTVNNKTVGFIKSAQNLIFIGLDNAGHFVPKDLPEASLIMLEKFTRGTL